MTCYKCKHFSPGTNICDLCNEEILNPESNEKCDLLDERLIELNARNLQLRKALQEIAEFAYGEYKKKIPASSCVGFMTIVRHALKALKGEK